MLRASCVFLFSLGFLDLAGRYSPWLGLLAAAGFVVLPVVYLCSLIVASCREAVAPEPLADIPPWVIQSTPDIVP